MCVRVCLFVCLFVAVNQSVVTTIDSGLYSPQGPFSTLVGRLGPFFIKGIVDSRRKIDRGYQHKVEETEKEDVLIELCTIFCTLKGR